jgi:predicted DNA-binding protein
MARDHLISVRVSEEAKRRFQALAARQGMTESALLNRLMELALIGAGDSGSDKDGEAAVGPRSSRLYVRLNAEDQQRLQERAARRDLRSATYAALLLRAHLRSCAPLPRAELAALGRAVSELSAIGRNLNQLVRATHAGAKGGALPADQAKAMLRVCEALRDHTKALIKANAASWKQGEPDG